MGSVPGDPESARLSNTKLQIAASIHESSMPRLPSITIVRSNASFKEINEVYHRLALHSHPNKNLPSREDTGKFQLLSEVYKPLSCTKKRSMYDSEVDVSLSRLICKQQKE